VAYWLRPSATLGGANACRVPCQPRQHVSTRAFVLRCRPDPEVQSGALVGGLERKKTRHLYRFRVVDKMGASTPYQTKLAIRKSGVCIGFNGDASNLYEHHFGGAEDPMRTARGFQGKSSRVPSGTCGESHRNKTYH
jgi:hypothetical protein